MRIDEFSNDSNQVVEQRRAKTRAIKQGMMQELLTGRVRLVDGEYT